MSIVSSILTGGVNNHATTNEEANALSTDFVSPGVVGTVSNTSGVAPATGGYAVNATGTPDANVQISAGTAYVTATPSTQGSQTIRLKNSATITQAISANSSGSTKYDWVYLSVDATNANAPNTAGDNVGSITVSRSSSAATDDGTPPTYAILLAVVTVANGFSTITNSVIRDRRTQTTIGATSASPDTFWTTGGLPAVSSVTENGNRSADITFASTVASILTPEMRLRTSRTVAAPTQCADLEASSSQYFSSASAGLAGMTFADDFTCMAWVKLESYKTEWIISRFSTNGYLFGINSSGQLQLSGVGGGLTDLVLSYQSIPLGKWVHVAASLNMSASTGETYIDGVLVPSAYTNSGATSITQAGDLVVGGYGAGTDPFDGKLAQVAVFSSVLSASTIRSYKNQGLTGSESTLVSAFSCNNSLLDLNTTNNNDLSANGGALMTNADSPFTVDANGVPGGTYDFAIVTKVNGTVATVQYPEGNAVPTSGGISTVDYSGVKAPFGMPTGGDRWSIVYVYRADFTQTNPVSGTWYNLTTTTGVAGGMVMTVPIGAWVRGYDMPSGCHNGTNQPNSSITISTANNTESDTQLTSIQQVGIQIASAYIYSKMSRQDRYAINLSTATTYYVNTKTGTASATTLNIRGSTDHAGTFYADFAYL